MSDKSIAERVIRVFADFKKVPPDEITMDTTFDELGFDSLDGLNLVFELEEEFDLTIPDDRVADMKGVRQAVDGALGNRPEDGHGMALHLAGQFGNASLGNAPV